jgi:hypothetical protein
MKSRAAAGIAVHEVFRRSSCEPRLDRRAGLLVLIVQTTADALAGPPALPRQSSEADDGTMFYVGRFRHPWPHLFWSAVGWGVVIVITAAAIAWAFVHSW